MPQTTSSSKQYLLASDFDQTLSFKDSGIVLSELLGTSGFEEKVRGLASINIVQQGGELAYLLLHDPEYRQVRREHLVEVGKRIRLKHNIGRLVDILENGIPGHHFSFYVVSAAPQEVVQSALEGIVPPEHIYGTRLHYDEVTGEIEAIRRVSAGYGKVAVLAELQAQLHVSPDRVIYVGDGSSDIHVMLHVNRLDGYTIAVSENPYLAPIARRTILSEDALSVLVPILEDIVGWDALRVRALFEKHGLQIQEWGKVHTDFLTIRENPRERAPRMSAMDAIGWVATAIFAASYFCKEPATLRRTQALAALVWIAYGVALQSAPVIVANVVVASLAAWSSLGTAPAGPAASPESSPAGRST